MQRHILQKAPRACLMLAVFMLSLCGTLAGSVLSAQAASATGVDAIWTATDTIIISAITSPSANFIGLQQNDTFKTAGAPAGNAMTLTDSARGCTFTLKLSDYKASQPIAPATSSCKPGVHVDVQLQNSYGSVAPTPGTGTATWTDQSNILYASDPYGPGGVSGNIMTLAGPKPFSTCAGNTMQVGNSTLNYKSATTAVITRYAPLDGSHCGTATTITVALGPFPGGSSSADNTDGCAINDDSSLRWVLCPVFILSTRLLTTINGVISNLMYTPTDQIFSDKIAAQTTKCTTDSNNKTTCATTAGKGTANFRTAFNSFRNIGIGLLVLAGVVMVAAQAAGLELFAAYTVRKALPRIVAAIIGMVVAWPVLQIVVTFFNDLGMWSSQLILASVHISTGGTTNTTLGTIGAIVDGTIGSVVAGVTIINLGWGILGLIGAALLALFVGFVVIAVVKLGIVVLILVFPLLIACSVSIVPGTDKIWRTGRDWLIGLLAAFPIIMAFLSTGAAVSSIAAAAATAERSANPNDPFAGWTWDLLSFIVLFVPYFLLGFIPKLVGGLFATVAGIVNDRHKGAFDRLNKFKEGEAKHLQDERMAGRRGLIGGRFGGDLYRRLHTRGGLDPTWAGRYKYAATDRKRTAQAAVKAVQEGGDISGDDYATMLASRDGMSRQEFLRSYAAREFRVNGANARQAHARATQALGAIEANFGQIGSRNAQAAAWTARAQSVTGYDASDTGLAELRDDAARMVTQGFMSESDAIQIIKSNKARADQSGVGWGQWQTALRSRSNFTTPARGGGLAVNATGAVNGTATVDRQLTAMRDSTISGGMPSTLVGGRPEAVKVLAPVMGRQIQRAVNEYNTTGDPNNYRELLQRFGELQKVHDDIARVSPDNARPIADMLDQTVSIRGLTIPTRSGPPLTTYTIHDVMAHLRQDSRFQETKREFPYGPGPSATTP